MSAEPTKEPIKNLSKQKPVESEAPKETQDPQTFVIKTETDAYIHSRLSSQPQSVETINSIESKLSTDAENILKLPKQIQDALDEAQLVPRWLNKNKRAIDHALDVRRWVIVNRTLFPKLPKHFFTANGTIENGDLILACMSLKRAEILRKAPGERSSERMSNLPMDRWKKASGSEKIGYYKPSYTAEGDGIAVAEGIQPDATQQQ